MTNYKVCIRKAIRCDFLQISLNESVCEVPTMIMSNDMIKLLELDLTDHINQEYEKYYISKELRMFNDIFILKQYYTKYYYNSEKCLLSGKNILDLGFSIYKMYSNQILEIKFDNMLCYDYYLAHCPSFVNIKNLDNIENILQNMIQNYCFLHYNDKIIYYDLREEIERRLREQ